MDNVYGMHVFNLHHLGGTLSSWKALLTAKDTWIRPCIVAKYSGPMIGVVANI